MKSLSRPWGRLVEILDPSKRTMSPCKQPYRNIMWMFGVFKMMSPNRHSY